MSPTFIKEDLWNPEAVYDLLVVTTNGYVKKDGRLVMGRGAALEAKDRYPGFDLNCGKAILSIHLTKQESEPIYYYGFLPVYKDLGIFQVKARWDEQAKEGIIKMSTYMLLAFLEINPDMTIRMNYPGIGFGGLAKNIVYPIISVLPKNVTICERLVINKLI